MGYDAQTARHTEIKERKMKDQKYGPQTVEIEALIERVETVTPKQIVALAKSYAAARSEELWGTAWGVAWDKAWYMMWKAEREEAWDAVWPVVLAARKIAQEDTSRAIRNATLALLVRDLIPTEQFDLLYGPWKIVMGEDES
jgi:hypothetical protein